jgi:hypothetical protein
MLITEYIIIEISKLPDNIINKITITIMLRNKHNGIDINLIIILLDLFIDLFININVDMVHIIATIKNTYIPIKSIKLYGSNLPKAYDVSCINPILLTFPSI